MNIHTPTHTTEGEAWVSSRRSFQASLPLTGRLGVPAWGGPMLLGRVVVRRQPPLPAPTPPEGESSVHERTSDMA
jgi:hypothetical protein